MDAECRSPVALRDGRAGPVRVWVAVSGVTRYGGLTPGQRRHEFGCDAMGQRVRVTMRQSPLRLFTAIDQGHAQVQVLGGSPPTCPCCRSISTSTTRSPDA